MGIGKTLLATLAAVGLGVGGIVVAEVTVQPSSQQRGMIGTAAFVAVAAVCVGLWAWHFKAGGAKKKKKPAAGK